ncbi:hypothetical protein KCV05_g4204, partial [Aureobasidium melanogenum]
MIERPTLHPEPWSNTDLLQDMQSLSGVHEPIFEDHHHGSNEEDILLVPLLRRAHWYLLHLDRRKRVILVYNSDRRVTDYQLRDICKAIIDKYTGTSSQTWKEPTDIKIPQEDHASES